MRKRDEKERIPSAFALRIRSLFVRAEGLEPPCLAAPDPKSGMSTNFTTPAVIGWQMYGFTLK